MGTRALGPQASATIAVAALLWAVLLCVAHRTRSAPLPDRELACLDHLHPSGIPKHDRVPWLPKKVVAVLGEHHGRHWSDVGDLAFSPNGESLASCAGSSIYLWNAASLTLTAYCQGHDDLITSVAYTPDGKGLVTSSYDGLVRIWIAGDGQISEKLTLRDAKATLHCVCVSDDGMLVAAGGENGVHLWESKAGVYESRGMLPSRGGLAALRVKFAGNSRLLAGFGAPPGEPHKFGEGEAVVWDLSKVTDPAVMARWPTPSRLLTDLCTRSGTSAIVTNGGISIVSFGNANEKPNLVAEMGGNTLGARCAAFLDGGKTILTDASDGNFKVFDVCPGILKQRGTVKMANAWASAIAVDRSSQRVAVARSTSIELWKVDGREMKRLRSSVGHTDRVLSLRFGPENRTLVTGSADTSARIWNLENGTPELKTTIWHASSDVRAVAMDRNGGLLATGGSNWTLRLFDISGKGPREIACHRRRVSSLVFRNDDGTLVSAGDLKSMLVIDTVRGGRIVEELIPESVRLHSVSLCSNGRTLVAGGESGVIEQWELTDSGWKKCAAIDTGSAAPITRLSANPKGTSIAFANGSSVFVLDSEQKEFGPPKQLDGSKGEIMSICWRPCGKVLGAADGSGKVVLWDVSTGKAIQTWLFPGPVYSLEFTSDGHHLATANGNGTVYILDVR